MAPTPELHFVMARGLFEFPETWVESLNPICSNRSPLHYAMAVKSTRESGVMVRIPRLLTNYLSESLGSLLAPVPIGHHLGENQGDAQPNATYQTYAGRAVEPTHNPQWSVRSCSRMKSGVVLKRA
jgi:hypothetical protein